MAARERQRGWVLVFDGACRECASAAKRIVSLSEGALTCHARGSLEADAWDKELQVEGAGERDQLVLASVEGKRVRTWTGRDMMLQLFRLVGQVGGLSTLRELTTLRNAAHADAVLNPGRRRALASVGASVLALGFLARHWDRVAAQEDGEIAADGLSDDLRLRVAKGQDRAELVRRWDTSSERRDLSQWFKQEGYDSVEEGLEFVLVYKGDRLQRSAAAQIWKKSGKRFGGVYLSLDGNDEDWYGITFKDEKAKTSLKVKSNGQIKESSIDDNRAVSTADGSVTTADQDSGGCKACKVGCVLGMTASIVTGATVCYLTCGVATFETLGAASTCILGCTAAVAEGTQYPPRCPDLCDFLGAC